MRLRTLTFGMSLVLAVLSNSGTAHGDGHRTPNCVAVQGDQLISHDFVQHVKQDVRPEPAVVQFVASEFSTDLPLAESKQPIHRVWLNCQLTDGGSGVLTLDPNIPKFDEFGEPVAVGNPSPLAKLDCTLKLIKKDKDRTLYEVRGPKIVSRLSLVAYRDIMPWGDGRLLVHDKDGSVHYVIDLYIPRPEPAPESAPGNAAALP